MYLCMVSVYESENENFKILSYVPKLTINCDPTVSLEIGQLLIILVSYLVFRAWLRSLGLEYLLKATILTFQNCTLLNPEM